MSRCNRSMEVRNQAGAAAGVELAISRDASRFTLRAVDAAGVPIAFSVELAANTGPDFHFVAGEAYSEENIKLAEPMTLRVRSAAGSVLELIAWDG